MLVRGLGHSWGTVGSGAGRQREGRAVGWFGWGGAGPLETLKNGYNVASEIKTGLQTCLPDLPLFRAKILQILTSRD